MDGVGSSIEGNAWFEYSCRGGEGAVAGSRAVWAGDVVLWSPRAFRLELPNAFFISLVILGRVVRGEDLVVIHVGCRIA